ncbi:hypothetical protein EAS64_10685 [Trebonia kvetii]|uniref:Nitrate/nitrite sensing protein domain-containing protein n=1 Tax=Trebonia kvetii TaxID=2480626 RepID=A0A6P2C3M7_9ACTN|nr:hypothetical protein EAS64_10685 [Trebonia kvetii]
MRAPGARRTGGCPGRPPHMSGIPDIATRVSSAISTRDFSRYTGQTTGALVQFHGALEDERTLSLRAAGGDRSALAALPGRWAATDRAWAHAQHVIYALQGLNQNVMTASAQQFPEMAAQLQAVRKGVQAGRETLAQVDGFYTKFGDLGAPSMVLNATDAPDAAVAVDALTAVDLLPVVDLHSCAGLGAAWAERGTLTTAERTMVARLTGASRNDMQSLDSRLPAREQSAYQRLAASSAWQAATAGEDELAARGRLGTSVSAWPGREPDAVPVGAPGAAGTGAVGGRVRGRIRAGERGGPAAARQHARACRRPPAGDRAPPGHRRADRHSPSISNVLSSR